MADERLIAGRYRLEGKLGTGGMSLVRRAVDTRLERPVAVKLLAEHLADDPAFVARFQREARAAARLVHPNVVQVFDSGLDEPSHRHYIVMELVSGPSCAELLRRRGVLDVGEAVDIVAQACRGLDYAHRHGVIHRDVKPGNLLISSDGTVKLADFGIAKATEQSSITQVGSVLGTAAYLAPEQTRGEEAGPGADIYALGVVAYQLLAGRVPYEAASLTELAARQQSELPPALEDYNPDVRPALARAIEQALALTPWERYETAHEMGEALHAAARGTAPGPRAGSAGDDDAATRVLARDEATAATRVASAGAHVPREPRRPREPSRRAVPAATGAHRATAGSRRAAPRAAAPPRRPSRAARALRRLFVSLIVLGLLAVAAILVVQSQTRSGDPARIEQIVIDHAQQGVDDLKSYIDENTR